jgi:ethanolamine utilization protein EutQ
MRQFFTGEDIRRLAQEEGCRHLLLAPEDYITAEAMDVAQRLGVQIRRSGERTEDPSLTTRPSQHAASGAPLVHVKAESVRLQPFPVDVGRPEMNIQLVDVITGARGSPMAAGFMTWSKGAFPWTLNYDEIDYVIEGQLEIRKGSQTVRAHPGDVIFIPRGSDIHFGSPSFARVFYVTFPADWETS